MTNQHPSQTPNSKQTKQFTSWQRMAEPEPIYLRDPLAEVLGMVSKNEPLVFTFSEIAKAAGHACPAVAGAYRGTQLALSKLYPDTYPVRSEIEVIVGHSRETPGIGPMANVISHITGASDERGFAGFNGYGGRENLLEFDPAVASDTGRVFRFSRRDSDRTVHIEFRPQINENDSPDENSDPRQLLPKIISGKATPEEEEKFYHRWHTRVQTILSSDPGVNSPFSLQ
ncbi:MAG: FmdE family protein, partial [Halobacteriaceae archaeon]